MKKIIIASGIMTTLLFLIGFALIIFNLGELDEIGQLLGKIGFFLFILAFFFLCLTVVLIVYKLFKEGD